MMPRIAVLDLAAGWPHSARKSISNQQCSMITKRSMSLSALKVNLTRFQVQ